MNRFGEVQLESLSAVNCVNKVLEDSIESKASDIHIEINSNFIKIRFRIDGELIEYGRLKLEFHLPLITRIKIMGDMDISEKRLPQDGRIEHKYKDKVVDIRISTLPTVYGEKVALRILDKDRFLHSKESLGLGPENIENINKLLSYRNGILLISGGTNSGKTTTLYSFLKDLNKDSNNIVTIEDPVEYRIEGVNQIQVKPKIGLDFANGLRSILRQDPDIIMIGEMRDRETAKIGIRAAITGHLVLSTIHTKDTFSIIDRLTDIGIENYLIASSIIGLISQRLVKKICENCKISYKIESFEKKILNVDENISLYKGRGCEKCFHTGYKGRIGVYEILTIDGRIRELIADKSSIEDIKNYALKNNFKTLSENGKKLAREGVTSTEEIINLCYISE